MLDEAEYANLGRDIASGKNYGSHFRPPVVPIAVAATLKITGLSSDEVIKLPIALMALVCMTLVYYFTEREFDPATGLVAAGCLGAMPGYWIHTTYLLTEIPFMMFFAGACFCFAKGLYGKADWFFGAWAFTGFAFLTRYTCVLLGPVFVLFVILGFVLDREEVTRKLRSKKFWLSPLLGLAIQLPWLIRQFLTYGDPLVGFKYAAGQLQRYIPEVSMPAHFYLAQLPDMLTIPVLLLVLTGLAWTIKTRNKFAAHSVLAAVFLICWFSAYRYKEFRLATAILPFLAVVAGVGYGQALKSLWNGFSKVWVAFTLAVGLGLFSNYLLTPFFAQNRALGYPSLKNAVKQLSQYGDENTTVMVAPKPQFSWYSQQQTVGFPKRTEFFTKLATTDFVVAVTYERGQPDYVLELVRELFTEPPGESKKYFIVSDEFQNHTFVTSGAEFRNRLLKKAKASRASE